MEKIRTADRVLAMVVAWNRVFPYCITNRDLSNLLGIASTSHTAIVLSELERHGLIGRVPGHARTLHATEKGKLRANIGLVQVYARELKENDAT